MDTERFDHLSTVLATPGTRRQALRSLAGAAMALAVAGALGADEGEAKKKRKKGKKGKGKTGGSSSGGGQNGGSNSGGGGNDGGSIAGGDGNGGGGATQTEEEKLLDLINNFRAQNGQPALVRNGKLDTAALNHSRDMANRGFFSHTSPEGGTPDQRIAAAGYSYSWWGENIYKSAPGDDSAQSAFTSWVNSSGHRANMLSSNFTQIGIGRATASDGRTYWTNTFGRPA
ncbi:MAG: CAP domain-containing protein [Thermomicrobiales bacterium]